MLNRRTLLSCIGAGAAAGAAGAVGLGHALGSPPPPAPAPAALTAGWIPLEGLFVRKLHHAYCSIDGEIDGDWCIITEMVDDGDFIKIIGRRDRMIQHV